MTVRGFFVTGTDTGVGKTLVTAGLLLAARAAGRRALGLKPLAAGAGRVAGRPVNADALLLQQSCGLGVDYDEVNPVLLQEPLAPHIAALHEGRSLAAANLQEHVVRTVARWAPEVVLVEGAGGWLVPLNDRETMADVAVALGYPVILVVAMRLGCLNHALLTARAITATGLTLAGWVANTPTVPMDALDENLRSLEAALPALRLGTIPFLGPACGPAEANTWLDATSLLGP